MANKQVDIDFLLNPSLNRVILDVRSPGEFDKAHIPNAVNLPLFSNEERAVVGTAYKQVSPDKAMLIGLEFAGQKMKWYVERALELAPDKKVLVHCWRGGKRSGSIAWLLGMAGFDVTVLTGGYKTYRQHIHEFIEKQHPKFVVIGGQTGSGKTIVLHELKKLREQIIDLEKLANHKGSAFGSLGEEVQPSTEHFENLLFEAYRNLDLNRRIYIENESQVIGTCALPLTFFTHMKTYYHIKYSIPIENRVQHLVDCYACFSKEDLTQRFLKIKNKLGGDFLNIALNAVQEGNFKEAALIALRFYDKTYQYGYEKNTTPNKIEIDYPHANFEKIATDIIKKSNELSL